MRKIKLIINPDEPVVIRIDHRHNYRVVPSHNHCNGCAFQHSDIDNIQCPAMDLTTSPRSRGLLCSSFYTEDGEQLMVKFIPHEVADMPRVFIETPVWERPIEVNLAEEFK